MFAFDPGVSVVLATGSTDLRKSFHGLCAIIKLKFKLDPYSKSMFAFCNRNRSLIKILYWDGSGFWLLVKKLDRGYFRWPDAADEARRVTLREIRWLTEGLSLTPENAFKDRHPRIVL